MAFKPRSDFGEERPDDPYVEGPNTNNDPGTQAPVTIMGKSIAGLISSDAEKAVVLLNGASGIQVTVPASSPYYAKALLLPPATAPDVMPSSVSFAQLRMAVRAAGLFPQFAAAIDALPAASKDAFQFVREVRRNGPLMNELRVALGMTNNQLNALFIAASKIDL